MYPVSNAFMQAIKSNTRKYYWTGTITTSDKKTYEFENEDIVKGSGYISRQCCGNSEIELGSVYAAELGISLFCDIDRYTLDGAEIKLWFHLLLDDGSTESIPMGVFYVAEANRRIKTLELKAYDGMLNLDKSLTRAFPVQLPMNFFLCYRRPVMWSLRRQRKKSRLCQMARSCLVSIRIMTSNRGVIFSITLPRRLAALQSLIVMESSV